jgi:predicted dithiol-disulfide oxidoreductase (DUF899 family)
MQHPVVSREEWLVARAALLTREKAMMKAQDALAVEQRTLPWVEIEENYLFEGPNGTLTFSELFDGRSQLFVHHFMISPDDLGLCVGCSFELDHVQGILEHLNAHDITYAVVAPIAIADIEVLRSRMGWRIPWVSSLGSDFTRHIREDFVAPGAMRAFDSVFCKDEAGRIFHTWSTSGRGAEAFMGIYRYIDVTPKGRFQEDGPVHALTDWVLLRTEYGKGGYVDRRSRYRASACACSTEQAAPI